MASSRKIRVMAFRQKKLQQQKAKEKAIRKSTAEKKMSQKAFRKTIKEALGFDKLKLKPRFNPNPIENWAECMLKEIDFSNFTNPLLD